MLSILKGLLLKLLPGFKAALPILLVIIFVLIHVAIWWAGPWLVIDDYRPLASITARAVTSTILVLLCFAIWGGYQWRQLAKFREEQHRTKQLEDDPILRLEQQQEMELNQVIQTLKKNLNRRNYLYALPWYLVLGLERSGKTSLINRSGQDFVFSSVMRATGDKSLNPYSFDWWIGEKAILIDPDGELLTQTVLGDQGDSRRNGTKRLWDHFVHWLEKTRSRRPLNGVVMTVDVSHLLESTNSERQSYAHLIRARLRELMETLSTRLPVYIVLTKLDLLYGFEPFFRHYSKEEREEVLGFTFTLNNVNDLDSWLAEFDDAFHQFIQRVNASLPAALMRCFDTAEKMAIYSFSRQISGLQALLHLFLKQALGSDQFSTSALVRGVYFSSVYQQGVPINAFINAVAQRYKIDGGINTIQQNTNSTTYFTPKLFHQIIYPEAGLATDNFRVAKNKHRITLLTTIACSIGTVLMILGWHQYYDNNVTHAEQVLRKVSEYKKNYVSRAALDSHDDILGPLNSIRDATLAFGIFRDKVKYFSDMGLYQGHTIGPQVEHTYLSLLEHRYLPTLLKDVAADLANAKDEDEKLNMLRVFKMLIDKNGRHKTYVQDYFAKLWQQRYAGNNITQEKLMEHLNYAMAHTDLAKSRLRRSVQAEEILRPYDNLVNSTQKALSQVPLEQWIYRNLSQQAMIALGAPLMINNEVGPIFEVVFNQRRDDRENLLIPRLLTREGYNRYFLTKSDAISELALIDSWVLGQSNTIHFSEEDKRMMREKVRDLYTMDYINTWRNAINDIEIKYFPDIKTAVLSLESLTSNTQPLSRLLTIFHDNTHLFPSLSQESEARAELIKSPQYQVAATVERQFSSINALLKEKEGQPPYINEVMEGINQLHLYMKSVYDAPDVGKAALEATKSRLTLNRVDPIYVLQRMATHLPKPMDDMVKKLADESWYVLRQEAVRYLEVRWQSEVYNEYKGKLAPYYPFNQASNKDVALRDFEQFFGPNGTFATFYEHNLKLFIDEGIQVNGHDNLESMVRSDVLKQFQTANQIQKAFFNRKGILDVSFALEPVEMSANKRRGIFNIDGQYVEYSHGPRKYTELVWPNTLRDNTVSQLTLIPVENNRSPRSINLQGPWSFFRLLEQGEVVSIGATSVDYKFYVDHGYVQYRIHTLSDVNPFTLPIFKTFKLSHSLY